MCFQLANAYVYAWHVSVGLFFFFLINGQTNDERNEFDLRVAYLSFSW